MAEYDGTPQIHRLRARPGKNPGLAIVLTLLLGPLGLFYASFAGAILMLAVTCVVGIVTRSYGVFLSWPVCMVWALVATTTTREDGLTRR